MIGAWRLVLDHGLRAAWSKPLISNGEVLGTFRIGYSPPRTPNGRDLELIEAAERLASAVISHLARTSFVICCHKDGNVPYSGEGDHPDLWGFGNGKRAFFWIKQGKPDPAAAPRIGRGRLVRSFEKDVAIHADCELVPGRDLDGRLNIEVATGDLRTGLAEFLAGCASGGLGWRWIREGALAASL
jgi:hypothetical protein